MNREEILKEATKCVMIDRNNTHGEPEDNFNNIAKYWTNYMTSKYDALIEFEATDIAAMMMLMKVARLATSPQVADHWIDIAGYAACGGGIATVPVPPKAPKDATDTSPKS